MPNRLPNILLGLLFAYFGFVIFTLLDDPQLEIYDEARRAVSALELARGDAPSLLTPPYYGEPDHWGTKPPLLVWSQAAWMKIVGVGELAVRLPSALATLALCFLLTWWGKKDWGSPLAGALGALAVLSNWEYMGNHGARTGDFDALLVLFLTAQLIFLFRWVKTDQIKWLWLAGLAVFMGGMTKGVAGGFLLPGIGLWFLVDGAARRKLLHPGLYGIVGGAIALVVGYYFLRETVDPGYLDLVKDNELGGRFNDVNESHQGPFYFYLQTLFADRAFGYLIPLLLPALVYLLTNKELRRPAALLAIAAAVFLVIISSAATKLYWYKNPVLPLVGMLVGAGMFHLADLLAQKIGSTRGKLVAVTLLAGLFIAPMVLISHRIMNPRDYQETSLRKAGFRTFMRRGDLVKAPYTVLIDDYHPNARFYVEREKGRGKDISLKRMRRLRPPLVVTEQPADAAFSVGERVVVCHTKTWEYMFDRYTMDQEFTDGRCKLLTVRGERLPIEDL
ncbi:ArnT family glycosyltransferase [Neolewinella persica]|uniref:ArnT family glycosyltransferase n=1 Tax=Neolewinella persica TaxID=70998 RepID=UPI0003615577|nr:glycosyltransferase family 39 protein [Neolewinella persica]